MIILDNDLQLFFELLRADGSVIINKKLARSIGINAAILYSELISKYLYFQNKGELDEEGYFFNTVDNLERDTCLSKFQQLEGIDKLINLKLIAKKLKGMPAKRYFKILLGKSAFNTLKALFLNAPSSSQETGQQDGEKLDTNNTNLNNTKSKQPAEFESLKKELEDINFSKPEIDVLLEIHTPEQIRDKLKVLGNRKGIRNPKLYFIKILKADYPNKDIPVIEDNGNNGNHSDDSIYQKWVVKKDPLTPEERKKKNERIAELAGETRKKLGLVKGGRELINN